MDAHSISFLFSSVVLRMRTLCVGDAYTAQLSARHGAQVAFIQRAVYH